jgi:hypothetical protein
MDMTAMTAACAKLDHAAKANHAAMRGRVACCQQQENPERRIKTKHHGLVGRFEGDRQGTFVMRLQYAPYHDHHGKNASRKQQSHQRQHDLEGSFSIHDAPLLQN